VPRGGCAGSEPVTASTGPGFDPTAWSWVEHLRAGGSTPWLAWADAEHRRPVDPGAVLPGAAQLEVVRRLAERRSRTGAAVDFPGLADLVLQRSVPGRGMGRLPLLWPTDEAGGGDHHHGVGAPPVDPARVPTDELIRVAVGAFAGLLQQGGWPEPPPPRAPRRWPWSRPFRLAGAPVTAAWASAGFRAAGHPEGGWRPHVVLFVPPFDVLLSQVWSARVQRGASVRWRTFLGVWAGRSALPPAADVTAIAARWRERVGAARVHVIAGSGDEGWQDLGARRTAEQVLGLRFAEPADPADLRPLPLAGLAVLRRLNRLLSVRAEADQRRVLQRRAASLLGDEEPTGCLGLRVPDRHRPWVADRAQLAIERLRAEGYSVHGDLDQVAPAGTGQVRPRRPQVLDRALDACLRAAERAT
jgi:hypothetical protein